MDDVVTYALLTASAVFVVLSIVMLARYRQASQRISASTDLGHDLWETLETRLKKQDERILDMMARVEVIQSRAVKERTGDAGGVQSVLGLPAAESEPAKQESPPPPAVKSQESREPTLQVTPAFIPAESEMLRVIEARLGRQEAQIMEMLGRLEAVQSFAIQRANPSVMAQGATAPARKATHTVSITTKDLLQMLSEKPRTPREIMERFDISREHATRLLKRLFDNKLAARNDSNKPYVYELTDEGRSRLAAAGG